MKVIKISIINFFIIFALQIITSFTIFPLKSVTYELGVTIATMSVISVIIAIFITLIVSVLAYIANGKNKRIRMALIFSILAIIISFQVLSRMKDSEVNIGDIGIDLPKDAVVLIYKDTHGGFHGDGDTFAKIEFNAPDAENIISQIINHKEWNKLPLSENLNLAMYGGKRGNMWYGYNFAEELGIPYIENGYWFFDDRHRERISPKTDVDLLNRYSFNFTLAMYDIDTNTLYYFEYDT